MTALEAVRRRPAMAAALLGAAALAWWWTVERMAAMDAAPGADLGTLGWFAASWAVMMAAMMLPSLAPRLATFATVTRGRGPGRVLLFSCGYLLAWAAAGLVAYGLFELGKGLVGSDLPWAGGGRWVSGCVLALAAAYQFTPVKHACLTRCRGPLSDMQGVSRQGSSAALAMGLRNGAWCIGCSCALMAALFALGVMSLTWMALVAGLVAFEKTGPSAFAAKLATATVLAVLAVAILAAPQLVPGLVLPGSGGMHAMKAMG
jgi:predicted metal-binding membrane protein